MSARDAIGRLIGIEEQRPYECQSCGRGFELEYYVCPECGGFSVERT